MLASVVVRLGEVLSGRPVTEGLAELWEVSPQLLRKRLALPLGAPPIDLLGNRAGMQAVLDELGRIESGDFV